MINCVFMCVTPLQIVIALKIIEVNKLENPIFVITGHDNNKFNFYINALRSKKYRCYFFNTGSVSKINTYFTYLKYYFFLNNSKELVGCVGYLASMDSLFFQSFISKKKINEIYTFDDGFANIFPESYYYKEENKYGYKRKLLNFIFHNNLTMNDLKKKTIKHYTIYEKFRNIVKNTQFLDVFNFSKKELISSEKVTKFFLGQPISIEESSMCKILYDLKIDYYYKHPREINTYKNVNYMNSDLIFEEFIINYIKKSNTKIVLYSFFSTACLNLIGCDNIEIIFVKSSSVFGDYDKIYDFLAQNKMKILDV